MNKIIVANMKMNLNNNEIKNYLDSLENKKLDSIIFCPTSIYIPYFIDKKLNVGIQNISEYENGNHTGQISGEQAKSIGVKYTIIGHSEIKESKEIINKKIKICKKNNLIPILCVGERKQTIYKEHIIKKQLNSYLKDITIDKIIIAYEPAFMINSKNTIDVKHLQKTINFIKKITKNYKINDIIVLYGGSIDENNLKSIKNIKGLDGYLIGNSSLNIKEFLELIEVTEF